MPSNYTYPGVYVEEIPSGVRTLVGVATSNTAFVDFFKKGPTDRAVQVTSFGDFERQFGGLDTRSEGSYAVQQYFRNGGSVAWIIRVMSGGIVADRTLTGGAYGYGSQNVLTVKASSAGSWGNAVQVGVDHKVRSDLEGTAFNLVVREVETVDGETSVLRQEVYRNLTTNQNQSTYVENVVNENSQLVAVELTGGGLIPGATGDDVIEDPGDSDFLSLGTGGGSTGGDGDEPGSPGWDGSTVFYDEANKKGFYALEDIAPEIFNILCIPAAAELPENNMRTTYNEAIKYCESKRAFLIIDIPRDKDSIKDILDWRKDDAPGASRNSAIYFPRLQVADALNEYRLRNVGASGTIAGIYARTDSTSGVWVAPAGTHAGLRNAELAVTMTDKENGRLNPRALNALRAFPSFGKVCWGARTTKGDDQLADEYKYVPVRRLALYIEESLYQGLHWAVFAPNDEPLWAEIRLAVGGFMHDLFRQHAFAGKSPRDAYFVKCSSETTTQIDIDRGIVNIHVGFAPLKPAEFVVIKLQQIAGQVAV